MTIWYGDAETLHRSIDLPEGLSMVQASLRAHLNRRRGEDFIIVDGEGNVMYSFKNEGR